MSNLGKYQDLTTAAKAAGGVDPYLSAIKQAAMLKGAGLALLTLAAANLAMGEVIRRRAEKAEQVRREQVRREQVRRENTKWGGR